MVSQQASWCGHDGQYHCRGMLRVMVNGVGGSNRFPTRSILFAGVEISIEPREIAAADFKPHPVTLPENVACGPEIDRELIGLAGVHESRLLLGIPVARSQDSLRQILCKPIWPHVNQFGDEVRVYG